MRLFDPAESSRDLSEIANATCWRVGPLSGFWPDPAECEEVQLKMMSVITLKSFPN